MITQITRNRIFKFLICGIVTALFNILLISIIIELFKINHPLFRNIANILALEVSVIFSFFVYRTWVWTVANWTFKEIIWKQIPLYHLSCSAIVCMRIFFLFPVLDWLGVNYKINTLIGIIIGSVFNYIISDRLVFKSK